MIFVMQVRDVTSKKNFFFHVRNKVQKCARRCPKLTEFERTLNEKTISADDVIWLHFKTRMAWTSAAMTGSAWFEILDSEFQPYYPTYIILNWVQRKNALEKLQIANIGKKIPSSSIDE